MTTTPGCENHWDLWGKYVKREERASQTTDHVSIPSVVSFYMPTDPSGNLGMFTEKSVYENQPNYYMSIAMLFGSLVAGATAEGGGAVVFPVSKYGTNSLYVLTIPFVFSAFLTPAPVDS
jgi:hypothetical protein